MEHPPKVRWPTTVTTIALTPRQKKNLIAKRKTHSKKNNLTAKRKRLAAKRKTSRQKEKDSKQKETLTAKRKRLRKISSIARGHFNSYFFCREVVVILFVVRLFFLP